MELNEVLIQKEGTTMKQEIISILAELEQWRKDRRLSIESQREGYIRNVMEELGELADAIKQNDIHEYIDALCDIVVFAGNCVDKEKFTQTFISRKYEIEIFDTVSESSLLKSMLGNASDMTHSPNIAIAPLYSFCRDLATKKGYNFYKCMQEVLKQINSRTGEWNDELNKWVKDISPEAKAKEYQADFSKCLLKKDNR